MTKVEEYKARYLAAMHAMQSGVALLMQSDAAETSPKHLRVGVNSSLLNAGALAAALIKKGVLTEEEYFRELAEAAEREQSSYERKLSAKAGVKVTLA